MGDDLSSILDSTARLTGPLLFVALGELMAQRAGTLNISVEGMMLLSAFIAVVFSDLAGSAVVGLLAGIAAGVAVATVQAYLAHRLRANQFVVGLALNVLVLGLTGYLLQEYRFSPRSLGVVEIPGLHSIPLVGDALFAQAAPFYLLFLAVPAVWWVLWRSRFGLELRAAGENASSSHASGIPVNRRRRQAILLGGAFAGLGGAYLSVGVVGSFTPNMTAGRGYLAIAAVLFGAWTVRGTVLAALLFGFADALRLALPALGYELNAQLLIAAPYLAALAAMLTVTRSSRQPACLGMGFAPPR
jgi:simple sugar transport system permease protein